MSSSNRSVMVANNHNSNKHLHSEFYSPSSSTHILHNSTSSSSSTPSIASTLPHHSKSNGSLEDYIYELQQRAEQELIEQHVSSANSVNSSQQQSHPATFDSSPSVSSHPKPHIVSQQSNYSPSSTTTIEPSDMDFETISQELAKKEKDLILAAELGKALLERNEELTRTNETINEEFTRNLEVLEQEKYAIRKKLTSLELDHENKIQELQHDLLSAKEALAKQLESNRSTDSDNAKIIEELSEQIQRLSSELKKSTSRESILEKEIKSLKEQVQCRRSNMSDHIGQLEGLRDEINMLSRRKAELESRIDSLSEEKENISMTLDESQSRIMALEKAVSDRDRAMQNAQRDLDELRRTNTQYQNRIDSLGKNRAYNSGFTTSLYNEIEMSSGISQVSTPDHHFYESTESPDLHCYSCTKSKQDSSELVVKLRSALEELGKRVRGTSLPHSSSSSVSGDSHHSGHHLGGSSSPHDSGIQTGSEPLDEANDLLVDLHELIKNLDFMQCVTCQEFNVERADLERTRRENIVLKDRVTKLDTEVLELTQATTLQATELNALRDTEKVLREDVASLSGDGTQDEIVKRAWKVRDETIARKKTVEIELAKVRIELMHVNSQLLETIQQKVELSQQLEQWQVDMEILIEEQLKTKLKKQEKRLAVVGVGGGANNGDLTALDTAKATAANLFEKIRSVKLLNRSS